MNNSVVYCSQCILDANDDPDIYINENGVCNHCLHYRIEEESRVKTGHEGRTELEKIVQEVKHAQRFKKYDCILGISGGTDSSYLAHLAGEMGLRTLCVHLDNGWNSELAVSNIENLISQLNFDLFTNVLNWEEFRDLQISYFKAGVMDLEIPTDHAMIGCLHHAARKYKIKYILSGHNVVTEAVLPKCFNYDKADSVNIKNIHNQFGKVPLESYPFFGQKEKLLSKLVYRVKPLRFLDLIDYNKNEAQELLKKTYAWKDYGGKHYENIFTRFYQGYILPEKFGIDKRKAHLSNLICSGQITRNEAIEELKKPSYNENQLRQDMEFFLKKLGFTESEFKAYMNSEIIDHSHYGKEIPWSHYIPFWKKLKK